MKRLSIAAIVAVATASALHAQAPTPFKLGTFQQQGRTFVGIVRDSVVIDLNAADNAVLGRTAPAATDMRDVIARYDSALRQGGAHDAGKASSLRLRSGRTQDPAADHAGNAPQRGRKLPRTWRGNGAPWRRHIRRRQHGSCDRLSCRLGNAGDEKRAWPLGTQRQRHALESVPLSEGDIRDHRRG